MVAEFTRQQVQQHNNEKSAYIIIDSIVYDITSFAQFHPGGEKLILEYAGKDATEVFYAYHRQEIITGKFDKLRIGSIVSESRTIIVENPGDLSLVPYGEASAFQGFYSPFYNESHHGFRKAVREFYQTEIEPEAAQFEEMGKPASLEIYKKMGNAGILACRMGPGAHLKAFTLPGGVKHNEFDYFHEQIVHEENARMGYVSYQDSIGAGMVIGLPPVMHFAKKDVKEKVMHDSQMREAASIKTTAKKTPDGQYFIVNVTNGHACHYCTTAVVSETGISMLLIERSEGVETTPIKTSYSSCAGTAYIVFENVKVPVGNLLGKEGNCFQVIMFNFNHERWLIIAAILSATRRAVEECFKWANQRKVFGKSLLQQPVIRNKLANMVSQTESVQSWMENITYNMNQMSYKESSVKLSGPIALLNYVQIVSWRENDTKVSCRFITESQEALDYWISTHPELDGMNNHQVIAFEMRKRYVALLNTYKSRMNHEQAGPVEVEEEFEVEGMGVDLMVDLDVDELEE